MAEEKVITPQDQKMEEKKSQRKSTESKLPQLVADLVKPTK